MGYKLPEDATYYRSETDGYAIYNAECKFIGRAPKNEFAVLNTSLQKKLSRCTAIAALHFGKMAKHFSIAIIRTVKR